MIFQRFDPPYSPPTTHYGLVAMDEATGTPAPFLHVLQALSEPLPSSSSSNSSFSTITASSASTPHAASLLLEALQACPFSAAFWECTPISSWLLTKTQTPFECMLVASPALENMAEREGADDRPFREHFEKRQSRRKEHPEDDEGICVFDNLGKDATLVVPAYQGQGDKDTYCHLLSYLRAPSVPASQKLALLQRVGRVTLDRCMRKRNEGKGEKEEEEEDLVWVSTSGLGVAWLHVRVEDKPKYYTWQDYVARGRVGKRGGGRRNGGGARKIGKKY